jgi:putative phosphoesterase
MVEPVAGEPAATVDLDGERALLIADYHAGIEAGLRYERGVELPNNAADRRQRLLSLLDSTNADRLVVLGDLGHELGEPAGVEREELDALLAAVVDDRGIKITVAPGNHDGELAGVVDDRERVKLLSPSGGLLGESEGIGVAHGHTWPDSDLLSAGTICLGHEHPQVKLEDSVGGHRAEQAWLRGRVDPTAFVDDDDANQPVDTTGLPELVIFPAFNDRSGGTWVNIDEQEFLAPFLPTAFVDADCYLLDGTRLGPYRQV